MITLVKKEKQKRKRVTQRKKEDLGGDKVGQSDKVVLLIGLCVIC